MLTWLCCDMQQRYVKSLWCEITGSTNQKLSNILDHACSNQHKLSMSLLHVEQAKAMNHPVTTYAPIAPSLLSMDRSLRERMGKKFDICYMLAKEYPAIYELESRHGVDLGQSYTTKDSAKSFTHCITESQRSAFVESLLNNGSTAFSWMELTPAILRMNLLSS